MAKRRTSLLLALYLLFSQRAEGFCERLLAKRLASGKEDPARLDERRGIASVARPEGALIWFHAASVGEALSILELLRRLEENRPDLRFLVTTGTVTSAAVMGRRLPERVIHQFVPMDARAYVRRFLDHWRPDLAVWTESELWPALMIETHARAIPMVLLNARMSRKSADRWRWLGGAARVLLGLFDHAQVQDRDTAFRLRRLGMEDTKITITGTLKEGAAALPHDEDERAQFVRLLDNRPTWLAASTHAGEEEMVLDAHRIALRSNPRLLLILVPRHPDRGDEIETALQSGGWVYARRSTQGRPDRDCQVYLADTLGELGLWYRISALSFVGGSLVPIGGHNPFEPAALGSAIIHGPHVENFADIYARLGQAGAAWVVSGADDLARAVDALTEPDRAALMANAAWDVASAGAEVTDRAVDLLLDQLDRAPQARGQ